MKFPELSLEIYIIHLLETPERISSCYRQFRSTMLIDSLHIVTTEQPHVSRFFVDPPTTCMLPGYIPRRLRTQEKSVFYKHAYAIKDIAERNALGGVILEDDVVVNNTAFHKFLYTLRNTEILKNYDIVYFGNGAHEPSPCGTSKLSIVTPDHTLHKSKCADSYVVSKDAAIKISQDYVDYPPFLPVDWDMSLRIERNSLKVGWLQPGITFQGSQHGMFKSLIQNT